MAHAVRHGAWKWLLWIALAAGIPGTAQAAAPQGPRVWAHMCSWFTIPNRAHSRKDWPLGLGLEKWPGTPYRTADENGLIECRLAADAGIDAFAVDIFTQWPQTQLNNVLGRYLRSAGDFRKATGRAFYAAPCLDGLGAVTPTQLAGIIDGLCAAHAESPSWPKLDGRPIVWTYDGSAMTLANWQETFRLLRARGRDVVVLVDGFGWVNTFSETGPLPEAALDAWAALPVGFYRFRTDGRPGTLERAWRYWQEKHPKSLPAQLTVGTLWPGYWSSHSGWFVDPQHTKRLRDTFAAARQCRWLTVTTWNDYVETTQVEPGLAFGTARLDLVHSLLSTWRGDTPWPTAPRLYLSHPNEVEMGEPFSVEGLALLPPGTAAPSLTVILEDAQGKALARRRLNPGKAPVCAATCQFTLTALPEGRWVRLRAQANGKSYAGVPIPVWPAGYHGRPTQRGCQWRLGSVAAAGPKLSVTRENGTPTQFTVSWPGAPAGSFVHLRRNFTLLHYPEENPVQFTCDLDRAYGQGRPSWEVFSPLPRAERWGFFDAVGVTPEGTLAPSAPVWIDPPDNMPLALVGDWRMAAGSGDGCVDSSPYGNDGTLNGAVKPQWTTDTDGKPCLRFDGHTARVNLPGGIFPSGAFTFSARVRPEPEAGAADLGEPRMIFADINGPLVLQLHRDGRVEAYRAKAGGPARILSPKPLPFGAWSRVTVTYDLKELRLYIDGTAAGAVPCTGELAANVCGIGYNPFGAGSAYFRGCLRDVRLEAACRAPALRGEKE